MTRSCYESFAADLKSRGAAERTIEAYTYDLTQFFRFCGLPFKSLSDEDLSHVTGAHVQNFLGSIMSGGARFSTLRRYLASLRRFYDFLIESGVTAENPAARIRLASLTQDPIPEEKLIAIFRELSQRDRLGGSAVHLRDELILLFMIFLGVREYRIPRLTLKNLRKGEYGLSLRLTRHWSTPIDGVILSRLHAYLKVREGSCDALFLAVRRDRKIAASAVKDLLQALSEAAQVSLESGVLRSTYLWLQNNPERSNALLAKIAAVRN